MAKTSRVGHLGYEAMPLAVVGAKGFAMAAGVCAGCDKRYREGEAVWTDPINGDVKADMCCGPEEFDLPGAEFDLPTDGRWLEGDDGERVSLAEVMPRGRTAADKCPDCFQIPSASGACGCF